MESLKAGRGLVEAWFDVRSINPTDRIVFQGAGEAAVSHCVTANPGNMVMNVAGLKTWGDEDIFSMMCFHTISVAGDRCYLGHVRVLVGKCPRCCAGHPYGLRELTVAEGLPAFTASLVPDGN